MFICLSVVFYTHFLKIHAFKLMSVNGGFPILPRRDMAFIEPMCSSNKPNITSNYIHDVESWNGLIMD